MILTTKNIKLKRLTRDKIEMVRNWRNSPDVARFMEFRDIITPEMQQKWFDKINNENNYYFIIEQDEVEIGLINIRDIDYQKSEGEAGIFFINQENLKAETSFLSVLCMYDFVFEELLLKRIKAHIMHDNKVSIYFNKLLGYKKVEVEQIVKNQLYILEKENYYKFREKLLLSFEISLL